MQTEFIDYQDNLEGFVAYPSKEKRPLVILCHAWKGKDPFICQKAIEVAEWGYVGFALDMYGKGILGKSKKENASLKKPFMENREKLQKRVLQGFEVASNLPCVEKSRIAVIGFGFGGVCALDLARSGADIKGAISIYGHFDPPPQEITKPIKAKILALHGYDDQIVNQDEVYRFENEMNRAKIDWQVHVFGGTVHGFANPEANDPSFGILYNPTAAKRAWMMTKNFLEEVL